MRLVGQSLSMALAALVFAGALGSARLDRATAAQLLASNRSAFALFAALCAVGTVASLVRGRVRR
jgi:hypothetical protein